MLHRRSLLAAAASLSLPALLPREAFAKPVLNLKPLVMEERAPALGVTVVTAADIRQLEVFGVRRMDQPDPVRPDDAWLIGDNTMAITAALYGRLVEAGKARWDLKLSEVFPAVKLNPGFAEVTVPQLLAHRGGLDDRVLIDAAWLARAHSDPRSARVQRAEITAAALTVEPSYPVGQFLVSRLGYMIAGAALETLSGQDYEDLAKAEAFDWWGATTAGFGAPLGAALCGHARGPDGRLAPVVPGELADYPRAMTSATGAHLSLKDYAQFLQLILRDGGGWLKPNSLSHLFRPFDHKASGYAMGWTFSENEAWANGPVLTHQGSNALWRAHVTVAPARDLAVIAVCNADAETACQRATQLAIKTFGLEAPAFNELKF